MKSSLRQRGLWGALLLLAVFAAVAAPLAHARAHHSDAWAREHFAAAERMREALNGRPPADRTRHDYQRVLNAYRSVYLGAPASSKADPSVVAVAETLVEMGRRFDDDKILEEAIEQYKYLRREYPGSKYRFDGLFTIGEIYKDDLNDPEAARSTFQDSCTAIRTIVWRTMRARPSPNSTSRAPLRNLQKRRRRKRRKPRTVRGKRRARITTLERMTA